MNDSCENVVVVGGGVIGMMCAWYLTQAGHRVTVVDRGRIGGGCSHGNCGFVSPSHVLPIAQPGAVIEGLLSLIRPNSPFCVRWKWSPQLWYWLWRFAGRCNPHDMHESAVGIAALLQSSRQLYQQLVDDNDISCEWQHRGLVFVFQSQAPFEHFGRVAQTLYEQYAIRSIPWNGKQLATQEPALKEGLGGGWWFPDDCHLKPDRLVASLKGRLEEQGTRFVEDFPIQKFTGQRNRCRAIQSGSRSLEAQAFIVATGAWTPLLNQHLGCRIPIQPGKGYSITMPHPAVTPTYPLLLEQHRVAITPFDRQFRIGSTMEFAGFDSRLNRQRLELLKSAAAVYLREPHGSPIEEEWYGWRPMTWDGKPIVDRTPKFENVWLAAGHNMLGISMATGTGKLLQELIDRECPHIDPMHYSLRRFGS